MTQAPRLRVPDDILRWLRQRLRRLRRPAVLGMLRSTEPLSRHWGFDRGTPVDRYYIERFLAEHAGDIRGRVLEVQSSAYTYRFGSAVERADVLDIDATNPRATIVADLAQADAIPSGAFECFILTQTLQLVYDLRAAVAHAHRILGPGGVLLATVPTVSRICYDPALGLDLWRFTAASCTRLFGDVFGSGRVAVRPHGNVLAAVAFLAGLSYDELSAHELEANDPYYPVVVTIRAVKGGPGGRGALA
jgi:SAM-dependent methyltransferase